jgi:hypothetical protein
MDVFFAILLFALAVLLIGFVFAISKDEESAIPMAILGSVITVFIVIGIFILDSRYNSSIEPIDVYRGKTTLEITYRDSVAVDSVVVWKEETK